jgi:hypothetical protein
MREWLKRHPFAFSAKDIAEDATAIFIAGTPNKFS